MQLEGALSLGKKLNHTLANIDTSSILILIVIIAILSLFAQAINESVLTSQSVFIILVSIVFIYTYIKKKYSKKLKYLNAKNKLLKQNTILDELCENEKTRKEDLCRSYTASKKNFYKISNLLLEQYNM